jgi:hypothetical protein
MDTCGHTFFQHLHVHCACVIDTGGKSVAGAYDTGGKLISSVNNASSKVITIVNETVGHCQQ